MCNAAALEKTLKRNRHWEDWWVGNGTPTAARSMLLLPQKIDETSNTMSQLIFTSKIVQGESVYTHTTHMVHSMPETVAHRILRSSKQADTQPAKVRHFYNSLTLRKKT